MRQNPCTAEMTEAACIEEIQGLLKQVAGRDHPTVQRAIETAARRLDIPFSRAFNAWYGRLARIDAAMMDRARKYIADKAQNEAETIEELKRRADEMAAELDRLRAAIDGAVGGKAAPNLKQVASRSG